MCLIGMLNRCVSCLGSLSLLHPLDVIINVSYGALWQKHVAWAKPDGDELRHYITSRYSTNMVLLSLLLATEIHVFFNSSHELVQMRSILGTYPIAWDSLQFWIGLTILLDVCVTLMGLIATFTLWGMISAISDSNSHCLLRSSLGQYVTSLPPRFALASIYLFLLWILLFVIDLVVGPLAIVLVVLALIMFFSIVLPLSAFGRLIMHTGAMSQRPVLSADLEKDLLPSGLQSSLLIHATHRQRRNVCVTAQYRRQAVLNSARPPPDATTNNNLSSRAIPSGSGDVPLSGPLSGNQEGNSSLERIDLQGWVNSTNSGCRNESKLSFEARQGRKNHRRLESGDTIFSDALLLPRASILNATISRSELRELIETSLTTTTTSSQPRENSPPSRRSTTANQQSTSAPIDVNSNNQSPQPSNAIGSIARPSVITKHHRRVSSAALGLLSEWAVESDVRNQYGAGPPADLPSEIDIYEHTAQQDIEDNSWSPWRRSSPFLSLLRSPNEEEDQALDHGAPPPRSSVAAAKMEREDKDSSLTQPLLREYIATDDYSKDDESILLGEEILQQSATETKTSPSPRN